MNPEPLSSQVRQPDLFHGQPAAVAAEPHPEDALGALAAACAECRRCGLVAGRQQVVVSRGDPAARLMVIGEGPGAQEDASGSPFVGRAGQLLDQMLASVAIDSNRDAYICNVVKCRPPDNRKPTPAEMAACLPWLERQIQLVDPAVILLAGATAMEGLLGVKGGITRLRGQWRRGEGAVLGGRWLMPIFHPSYLLRNPSRQSGSPKWLTWQDLQDVRRRLDQLAAGGEGADPSLPPGL
ncbi:MAG: uracil-DNA glycosylase [Prochlorococcaceae cyanobacterium]|jgi:uracil-DNA glycosylase family 4